jgi:hypothetical protein
MVSTSLVAPVDQLKQERERDRVPRREQELKRVKLASGTGFVVSVITLYIFYNRVFQVCILCYDADPAYTHGRSLLL